MRAGVNAPLLIMPHLDSVKAPSRLVQQIIGLRNGGEVALYNCD